MACAIASTLQFSKQKPPPYPEMPFKEEDAMENMGREAYVKVCRENRREKLKRIFQNHKK